MKVEREIARKREMIYTFLVKAGLDAKWDLLGPSPVKFWDCPKMENREPHWATCSCINLAILMVNFLSRVFLENKRKHLFKRKKAWTEMFFAFAGIKRLEEMLHTNDAEPVANNASSLTKYLEQDHYLSLLLKYIHKCINSTASWLGPFPFTYTISMTTISLRIPSEHDSCALDSNMAFALFFMAFKLGKLTLFMLRTSR